VRCLQQLTHKIKDRGGASPALLWCCPSRFPGGKSSGDSGTGETLEDSPAHGDDSPTRNRESFSGPATPKRSSALWGPETPSGFALYLSAPSRRGVGEGQRLRARQHATLGRLGPHVRGSTTVVVLGYYGPVYGSPGPPISTRTLSAPPPVRGDSPGVVTVPWAHPPPAMSA
jgi:hypothetical protein